MSTSVADRGSTRNTVTTSRYAPVALVENILLTSSKFDFNGNDQAYWAAARWDRERLEATVGDSTRKADTLALHAHRTWHALSTVKGAR